MTTQQPLVETDVLIVGTGPAGSAAAATLSTYGVRNTVVSRYGWTCRTPRAHITNQRTMEVLRDLGLEAEAKRLATPYTLMGENPFCTSLAGKELGRIRTWGNQPDWKADHEKASPTQMCDLPQNYMEPILLQAAAHRGSEVRFNTEYLGLEQDEDGVTATVRDRRATGDHAYRIRAKYLIGADGANSKVAEDIGLPIEGKMGLQGSMNIVFEANLSRYVAHRPSVLYWVIQPGSNVGGLGIGVVRMVRPWYRWLFIWGYEDPNDPPDMTEEFATNVVYKLIGEEVPVEIQSTSTWTVNSAYATEVSRGRVFCAGDAVHRHSPMNGLGSNVSIQDSYNLAWKLALVLKGWAAPSLLETYDAERAPVAEQTVKRATKSLEPMAKIMGALGLLDAETSDEMWANMAARKDATPEAAEQRAALRQALNDSDYVYNTHGVEMNQRYDSAAIVPDGTEDPGFERDPELYYQASSRPGAHLPHAWLTDGDGHKVSTIDLCGRGRFALLTGIGGEVWAEAAREAEAAFGVEIDAHVIGPGREYDDPYGDFGRLRETAEDGALLVRPDMFVAWRAHAVSGRETEDLTGAMGRILGRSPDASSAEASSSGVEADPPDARRPDERVRTLSLGKG
jgi:2,4-dichlorophenol 6-monooxygenase